MNVNLSEGIFLGKQELEQLQLLSKGYEDGVSRLVVTPTSSVDKQGLFNPFKVGYQIRKITVGGIDAVQICVNNIQGRYNSQILSKRGRLVVGRYNDQNIGVVSSLFFTGKECLFPITSFPEDWADWGSPDFFIVLRLKPATTHYENVLISIDSNGVGTFSQGSNRVIDLFRTAQNGRQSKIKLSDNTILTVQSVNFANNTVQFVCEGQMTAKSNMQFMFLQTLSPFAIAEPQPLYTYDTCEIITDGVVYAEDPDQGLEPDGESCPVVRVWSDGSGGIGEIEIIKPEDLLQTVPYIDTYTDVLDNSISTIKIVNGAVDRTKIATKAFGYREKITDKGQQDENISVVPGMIGTIYNNNNEANHRFIVPSTPSGWSLTDCILQPAKILLMPEQGQGSTNLKSLFGTTPGLTLVFDADMEGQTTGSKHWEIFDLYWVELNKVLVKWSRINI